MGWVDTNLQRKHWRKPWRLIPAIRWRNSNAPSPSAGRGDQNQAETDLRKLAKDHPTGETLGLLGRISKDRWTSKLSR